MLDIKVTGLKKAIDKLQSFRNDLPNKVKQVAERLMQEGYTVASVAFSKALYEGTNDVKVLRPVWIDETLVLYATGNAVAFIEFGTSVNVEDYPTQIYDATIDPYSRLGISPHGEYDKKQGSDPPWYYPAEKGLGNKAHYKRIREGVYSSKWAVAFGSPPARAMYQATETVANKERALEIAKEVFKV